MYIKDNYVKKQECVYVTERYSLEDALETLRETGYRCIPVLSTDKKKFLGNIYKTHVLEKATTSSTLKIPVSSLLADVDETIQENSSFFDIFFSIKRLPYIAVLDDNGDFVGIMTHAKVLTVLEDSWGAKSGSYSLTIGVNEYKGALLGLIKIINKFTSVQSLITLDSDSTLIRRVVVTLSPEIGKEILNAIVNELNDGGYRVVHIEQRDTK